MALFQKLFQEGQALPKSSIIPAAESEQRKYLVKAQRIIILGDAIAQRYQVIRAKSLNRVFIGQLCLGKIRSRFSEEKSRNIERSVLMGWMQSLTTQMTDVFSNYLVI